MKKNTNLDLSIPLEEAKRILIDQMDSIATIKDTLKTIFNATALIVTVGISLQALKSDNPIVNIGWYTVVIVATLLMFAAVTVLCLWGMMPKTVYNPITMKWENLSAAFLGKDDRTVMEQMLAQVLQAIDLNKPVIEIMKRKAWVAGGGLVLVVVGLIGLILIR